MAFLRLITQQALTDVKYDVYSRDIHIEESERYSIAKKMFKEDKSILFFFYWNDADEESGRFYTYPIESNVVEEFDVDCDYVCDYLLNEDDDGIYLFQKM